MSVLMTLDGLCSTLPVSAAMVNYTPKDTKSGGTFEGEVGVKHVGPVKLTGGLAVVRNNVIDVEVPQEGTSVKKTVLSGVMLQSKVQGSGNQAKVSGFVYFRQGPSLTVIDDPDTEELIDIEGGGTVTGKITSINNNEVEIATKTGVKRVGISDVRKMCSPRIYSFVMPLAAQAPISGDQAFQANADQIQFTPTAHPCKKRREGEPTKTASGQPRQCCFEPVAMGKGVEKMPVTKIVAITAVMAAVAAAIAIPIAVAVPLATRNRNKPPVFIPPPNQPPVLTPPPPPPPPRRRGSRG